MENTPVLALKSLKWDGRVFWASVSCLCFKLPFCLFSHTKDTSVIYEIAKSVCFIDMQYQKSEIAICSNKHESGL